MEDVIQLVIFAILVLFAVLFGDKKKKRPPPQQRPPERRPRPVARLERRPAHHDARTIAEEILEQLKREREALEVEGEPAGGPLHTDEAYSLETLERPIEVRELPPDRERSLETLEAAGEASHVRFHERYVADAVAEPAPARRRLALNPRTARQAVVWMAVLGRPKGG